MRKQIALAAFVTAGLLFGQSATAAELIRVGGNFNNEHPSTIAMLEFEKEVEARSNGEIQVDLFPNKQLGGAGENVDQMRSGAILATWVGAAYLSRIVPELEAISLPFVFADRETAFRVIDGPVGDKLNAKLAEKGMVILGWMELGARHVTNNVRPLTSIDDFKDLKIRLQPNEAHLATFREIGANPVAMDVKELYSAMEQGVVDGQENPYAIIQTAKYPEVQKYLSDTSHFFDFIAVVANKSALEGLSPEHRKIVVDAMLNAVVLEREMSIVKEKEALDYLKAHMTFTALPDATRAQLLEATTDVVDGVRQRAGSEMVDMVLGAAKAQ